jgi:drug/metabolite transporter (DMT)-like permease
MELFSIDNLTMNKTSRFPQLHADPATSFALIALLIGAAALGFAPIIVRLSEVGPIATAFWRMAFALPPLAILMSREKTTPHVPQATWQDYRWLVLAGLFFAGDLTSWHVALHLTTVANSTILANCASLFVTLGAWWFFKQHITSTFILGLAVAFIGAIMLVGAKFSFNSQSWQGDALSVVTAMCYASYFLCIKKSRDKFSTFVTMTWVCGVTSLALIPVVLLFGETFFAVTLWGWALLIALALLTQLGGQTLIAYALAHLPAPFSAVTMLLESVMATLFAWLILSEALTAWQAIGGFVVLCGILLARRGSQI